MATKKKSAPKKAATKKAAPKKAAPKKAAPRKAPPKKAAPRAGGLASFGYKTGWLAIKSTDVKAVAKALGAALTKPSPWKDGIRAMYEENGAFLSEPVGGWILVADRGLMSVSDTWHLDKSRSALMKLSATLGTAVQLFASYRVVDLSVWMLADRGKTLRAFVYVGGGDGLLVNEGKPTKIEADIDISEDVVDVNEDTVMKVAGGWSLDPTALDEREENGSGYVIRPLRVPELRTR